MIRRSPVVCLLLLAVLSSWSCNDGGAAPRTAPQRPNTSGETTPQQANEATSSEASTGEAEGDSEFGVGRVVVELYFPAAEEAGLVGEVREIFETAAPGDRAKQIVNDLISGPTNDLALRALPEGTQLRQIYVVGDGTAYIDFSEDLRLGLGGGSTQELLTIYAIVDSVVLNVAEIKRVGILIDGEPVETLNGHLDLRRPLVADLSWIIGRVA